MIITRLMASICFFASLSIAALGLGQQEFVRLNPGDEAPDFQLKFVNGKEDRSLHDATRPTILFFGSYS